MFLGHVERRERAVCVCVCVCVAFGTVNRIEWGGVMLMLVPRCVAVAVWLWRGDVASWSMGYKPHFIVDASSLQVATQVSETQFAIHQFVMGNCIFRTITSPPHPKTETKKDRSID